MTPELSIPYLTVRSRQSEEGVSADWAEGTLLYDTTLDPRPPCEAGERNSSTPNRISRSPAVSTSPHTSVFVRFLRSILWTCSVRIGTSHTSTPSVTIGFYKRKRSPKLCASSLVTEY